MTAKATFEHNANGKSLQKSITFPLSSVDGSVVIIIIIVWLVGAVFIAKKKLPRVDWLISSEH